MPAKALAIAAFGARGTGKTAWVVQYIERTRPARLLIWDYKDDPPIAHLGQPLRSLPELARRADAARFCLRYVVNHDGDIHRQFEWFCKVAWKAGNLVMFVDELPEVTKANKAPPVWRKCVNVGRLYKDEGKLKTLTIIGVGQRPAECDKSFISNADIIHTGRLSNASDARDLADSLGVGFRDLLSMPDLEWIEKNAESMQPTRGKLNFSTRPKKSAIPKGAS